MNARAKQSLFDILGDVVVEAKVLDLFAGTGGLGIEALSRGADFCSFVEQDRDALECLHQNIAKARFGERSMVMAHDVFTIFGRLGDRRFSLCFFDPPYRYFDDSLSRKSSLEFLVSLARRHLTRGALLVLHYRRGIMAGTPIPGFTIVDTRQYGTTELMILEPDFPETATDFREN